MNVSELLAKKLLETKAVKLSPSKPFTWASGWKSPIYCDNRQTLSYPEFRTFIKEELSKAIKENFADVEVIAGVATAGIPQGALVAEVLGLPFIYVRSKPKGHGMTNMIEGKLEKGQKVVLIEDLVSTGGSSLKAAKDLREAGAEVIGMAAIFTYGFKVADENFSESKVPLVTLSDYKTLISVAKNNDYITEEDQTLLKSWRVDPANWNVK